MEVNPAKHSTQIINRTMDAQSPIVIPDDEGLAFEELKDKLLKCLDEIETTGDFANVKRYKSFVNPGLTIGETLIPLPLVPRDAETIKSVCRQAPFGKGEETLVDTSVRKTWELDHSQFKLVNPNWQSCLAMLLKNAEESLGLSEVRAEPYKLLLYEEGSFFKRHKDSEKAPGMVGTLVICLPSKHDGGNVHVSHAGKSYVFDTAVGSDFDLTSLAWFADVTHEVKPLTSGYRLVLTYNIIHTGNQTISAGLVAEQMSRLHSLIIKWRAGISDAQKLIYLLEHQYSDTNLSLRNLKGRDKIVCQSLQELSSENDFVVLLANMDRTKGDEEFSYYGVEEDSTELRRVITCDGHLVYGGMDVDEEEILGTDPWDRDPDSEDEGEFTGNENAPATYRYHNTVVVIAPMHQLHSFVSGYGASPSALINLLSKKLNERLSDLPAQMSILSFMNKAIELGSLDGSVWRDILTTAVKFHDSLLYRKAIRASLNTTASQTFMIETIVQLVRESYSKDPDKLPDWNVWLDGLIDGNIPSNTVRNILNFLEVLMPDEALKASFQGWKLLASTQVVESKRSLDLIDHDVLIDLLIPKVADPLWLTNWLIPLLSSRSSKSLSCMILHTVHNHKRLAGAVDAFRCILEGTKEKLKLQISDFPKDSWSIAAHGFHCAEATFLRNFTQLIDDGFSIGLPEPTTALLDTSGVAVYRFIPEPKSKALPSIKVVRGFLHSLIPILEKHQVPPLESVAGMCSALLRNVVVPDLPERPKRPRGWTHKPRGCTPPCMDCKDLNDFLRNSEAQTWVFRAAAPRRRHLECQLPMDLFRHHTDTAQRPQALVVTKLGEEFRQEMRKYEAELARFQNEIRPFQGEYMKALLGEARYRELISDNISGPEGARQPEPAGQRKRKADEELDGSSASRPRIIE
ncbi:hypothetical protein F4779DRAFT_611535 [Xylariaceae sp. FL0662B]|nr:hypothetical protein F4779DRAFT_611535 [Xylariaceae sp. FL0662B]